MFVSGENSNKQLFETQSNDGFFGDQCISPPKKVDFDVSKIKSFSSYSDHSVWINNDGNAYAIGNNSRSQINSASYGKYYEKPTKIKIDGFSSSEKEYFVSVVCGDNYTLYMTSTGRLIYIHEKGQGKPLFIKLKIPNPKSKSSKSNDKYISRKPLGLFGGYNRAAVIDEEGDFYIFSEDLFNSKNPTPKYYSLPESVTNVACCESFLVALTCSGKVYGNGQINEESDEFIEIEELCDFGPFIQISGTYEHCLALNEEGRVYGFGSNYKGRLSLDSEMRTVDTFVLLSAFDDLKVYAISAGFNHSLFLMKGTELASCGTNTYGELLAIKPTKDCYFTPIKTKIIAETKIPYFIAGCNTSFAFVDCEAPPNCPNKNIELKKKRIVSSKSIQNDPSGLTPAVRKKIEDSKSNHSKKYSKDDSNNKDENTDNNKNSESNNNNSAELKELQDKVNELTAALQKSEEEKTIVIKKLLELTQVADQLHTANKDLAARVLKYELTLGLLAVVANASDSSDSGDDKEEEEESDNKEKEEKEKKEKAEKERKEKEKKEKEEKERKEKERKEKERKEKERKEKERKEKEAKEKKEKDEKERKEKDEKDENKKDEKDKQSKKKTQDSKPKSSEDENKDKQKQTDKKNQQDSNQKLNEDENKQKQKSKQTPNQQKKSQQEPKSSEEETKQKQHRKQTDQKEQQQKKTPQEPKPKSNDDENKQKHKSQKINQPEEQQKDESEESSKRHHHHRHHRSHQEKQQQQENQDQQKRKPKEPSENSTENNQDQNKKHAPRRRHHHEKQQDNNNNNNDDSNNRIQKTNTPPSMLTQKENEQKKSIVKPSVPKK